MPRPTVKTDTNIDTNTNTEIASAQLGGVSNNIGLVQLRAQLVQHLERKLQPTTLINIKSWGGFNETFTITIVKKLQL